MKINVDVTGEYLYKRDTNTARGNTEMARITLSKNYLTVDGKRAGIFISGGPWVDGVPAELIKIYSKKRCFPLEFCTVLTIENATDIMTDYFTNDVIRLLPGHPLYAQAKALLVK